MTRLFNAAAPRDHLIAGRDVVRIMQHREQRAAAYRALLRFILWPVPKDVLRKFHLASPEANKA
jgi:hypothetical protein